MHGQSREAEQLNNGIPQSDILGDTRVNGWGIFLCFGMRGSPDCAILLLQNCLQIFVVSILTTGGSAGLVGPRPFLVRDCVFLTDEQRRRHTVRPGLTGLAQVNGRNNITWEQKFEYDLQYIDRGITFIGDLKIILQTVGKVLKRSDVVREGTASDMDYGDWLMLEGKVDQATYDEKQKEARELLGV